MFNADLISPQDVKRLADNYPQLETLDLRSFKFINIKPVELRLATVEVTRMRREELLFTRGILLNRHRIPDIALEKISKYIGESYRPLKFLF